MKKYTWRNPIEYLKDNPYHYWFKRKLYGYGWVPATKEGWFVTLGALVVIFGSVLWLTEETPFSTLTDFILFYSGIFVVVALLVGICYVKGEPPKWSWGQN